MQEKFEKEIVVVFQNLSDLLLEKFIFPYFIKGKILTKITNSVKKL